MNYEIPELDDDTYATLKALAKNMSGKHICQAARARILAEYQHKVEYAVELLLKKNNKLEADIQAAEALIRKAKEQQKEIDSVIGRIELDEVDAILNLYRKEAT